MKIYPSEVKLGLQQKILASQVTTAHCPVRPIKNPQRIAEALEQYKQQKVAASYNDLYYVSTVLVTAGAPYSNTLGGFNRNDDFFPVEEVWRARSTPVDKPTNIGHCADLVCGHMTRSWVLTAGKRKVVPDNRAESELPDTIHLACSAVIYRDLGAFYSDQISKLILQIEAGEMAVSMEAHFDEFDYALLDEGTGTVKVVARNDDTAWMTGLLRWFGGEGVYAPKDDKGRATGYYRVGRALRGITFTGKGFVTNPANPESIILNKSFEPQSSAADVKKAASNKLAAGMITVGKTNNKGDKKMSDIDPIQYAGVLAKAQTADKLEKDNEKLQAKVEKLQEEMLKADKSIAAFEMGKKEYETLLEAAKKDKEKDDKEKCELKEQLQAAKDDKAKDEKDKKEKCELIAKLEQELAEIKAAQQTAERESVLLKEGMDATEAKAFVITYSNFNDEQFKAVAATTIESHKTKAALAKLKEDGKIKAEDLETLTPEDTVDAKKDDKKEDKPKDKSKASLFASFSSALPKRS